MGNILTKIDLSFEEVRIYRQLEPLTLSYTWHLTCGYNVITAEGETIHRDVLIDLSPAQKTKVVAFFAELKEQIKIQEGL